jgi:carboxymethylenebutenolidase
MHQHPRRRAAQFPTAFLSALLLCAGLLTILAAQARAAAPPPTETVHFPSQGESVRGLLYKPAGKGPFPAIVVIHEWWGLSDWVEQQAADLAQQGYVTLAVDLYRGQMATDPEMAHELMRALPQDRGVGYLTAAVAYLKTRKDVESTRIGAVGWCMGGGFALQLAIAEPSLRAVAINYGALDTDPTQLKKIHAQVLGNFGALDRGITPADVQAFAQEMQTLGHPVNVKEYADAGHAFQNPNNKAGYIPADTADADRRMRTFFATALKK